MGRSIFHKLVAFFVLVVFLGGNFDFLVVIAAPAHPARPAGHDYKCYCSACYHYDEGCLCWIKPEEAEAAPDDVNAKLPQPIYRACCCPAPELPLILFSSELNKCLLFSLSTPPANFPAYNDWPENEVAVPEDLFNPSIFHPPKMR